MRQELANWKFAVEGSKGGKAKPAGKVPLLLYASALNDQLPVPSSQFHVLVFTLHTEEEGIEEWEEEKERQRPDS